MGATSDNYEIVTGGTTYTIASDYVNPFGGGTAHFQIVKAVYGTGDSVTNISIDTPLPSQPFGPWLRYDYLSDSSYYSIATTVVGYTGNPISVVGVPSGEPITVSVLNGISLNSGDTLSIRILSGGSVGSGTVAGADWIGVQGISGAYPVGITFTGNLPVALTSLADSGVYGVAGATAIGVTFGTVNIRGLSASTDSVLVYGGGTGGAVYVGIYGYEGGKTASIIHAEGNALNVNLKQAVGITVSAADLDIRNLSYTTDSVEVVGDGPADTFGRNTVPTYINAIDGNENLFPIGGSTGAGWCGAALNVFLVNQGITFAINANATFDALISVGASADKPVPVHGSTYASAGIWVTGSTNGDPVIVKGDNNGYLPVEVKDLNTNHGIISAELQQIKLYNEYMIALKKALYSNSTSNSAQDFPDNASLYTLVNNSVASRLSAIQDSIIPNGEAHSDQDSLAVTIIAAKRQPSFISKTSFVGFAATNLSVFNGNAGYTCDTGVRIKVSRSPAAAANEILAVSDSETTDTNSSYLLYRGDEMFFEVDNISKIFVFYPALNAGAAPSNSGTGITFSFYAS